MAYGWVEGMSFGEVCRLTTAQEGDVVRCLSRLEEVACYMSHYLGMVVAVVLMVVLVLLLLIWW